MSRCLVLAVATSRGIGTVFSYLDNERECGVDIQREIRHLLETHKLPGVISMQTSLWHWANLLLSFLPIPIPSRHHDCWFQDDVQVVSRCAAGKRIVRRK